MKLNRIFAIMLSIALCLWFVPSPSKAIAEDNNVSLKTSDMNLSGIDSFGNLLVDEYLKAPGSAEVDNGCNIFALKVNGTIADVSFETSQNCSLLVVIYDSENDTKLGSGVVEVTVEDSQKYVPINISDIPQYFCAYAYLIETDTLAPLSIAFKDTSHTKEMKEFLEKSVSDFSENTILNFDNAPDNNFAVYRNNVHIVKETATKNIVTKADFENDVYSFKDIDFFGFEKDDIIAVESINYGHIIFKVDYVISEWEEVGASKNDSPAESTNGCEIKGKEFDLEEVFEYVKIDTSILNSNANTYARSAVSILSNEPQELDTTVKKYIELEKFGIVGSIELEISPALKFYFSDSIIPKYIELTTDVKAQVEIGAEGKFELPEIEIGEINVGLYDIINIGIDVSVELGADGKLSTAFSFETKIGIIYDADSSPSVRYISSKPEFNIEVKSEFKPYIMLSLKPNLNFIKEDIVSIGMACKTGIEVKAETTIWELNSNDSIKHDCEYCIDGEIAYKCILVGEVEICKKKISVSRGKEITIKKIADFYYSIDRDEFGWGTCPYIQYKVSIQVKNENGTPVNDAEIINVDEVVGKTNKDGIVDIWLKDGRYNLLAKKGGLNAVKNIIVHSPKKHIVFNLSDGSNTEVEAKHISLGRFNTGFLTADGDLYTWGDNRYGALGIGSSNESNRLSPQLVMKDVKQFSMEFFNGGAVKKNGDLYMWGKNDDGQVGNGTKEDVISPVKVLENVREVHLTDYRSAAITNDGILYMWGSNWCGNAGVGDGSDWSDIYDSSLGNVLKPVPILSDVREVYLDSDDATAAITENGDLYIWGSDPFLPYIYGSYRYGSNTPQKVLSNIKSISIGTDSNVASYNHHTLAVSNDGTLYAWGRNRDGQLGDGTTTDSKVPIEIMDNVKQAIVANSNSLAVTEDGELYTWGYNGLGGLGDGTTEDHLTPHMIMENIDSIGYYSGIYYAIDFDSNLYVWGSSSYNMGAGSMYSSFDKPHKILENIAQVEFSWEHAAAVTNGGELYTWGSCAIGNGSYKSSYEPTKIELATSTTTLTLTENSPQILSNEYISSNPYNPLLTDDDTRIYNVYRIKKPAYVGDPNYEGKLNNNNLMSIVQHRGKGLVLLDGSLYFETVRVPMKSQIIGDANNDYEVTVADAVMLQKWLLGSGELTCWKNVDLCTDGKIDVFDLVMMKRILIS